MSHCSLHPSVKWVQSLISVFKVPSSSDTLLDMRPAKADVIVSWLERGKTLGRSLVHYGPAFGALELIGALRFLWGPQSLERGFSKAGLLLTIVGVGPVRGGEEGGVENRGRKTGDQSSRPRCLTHLLR